MKREFQQMVITKSAAKPVQEESVSTKKLKMTEKFRCECRDLYNALTTAQMISAWSRSQTKEDASASQDFSFFSGNVTGTYTQLVENEKVAMRWRQKSWLAGHHSNVTITMEQVDGCVELKLEQNGIPSESFDATKQGWTNYYWKPIKQCFGFGSAMF